MAVQTQAFDHLVLNTMQDECDIQFILDALESSKVKDKIKALQRIICLHQYGFDVQTFLMRVIRCCLSENDHDLRRTLYIYLSEVELRDSNDKALPEALLLVSSIRNDLLHPNEYIRSLALRFLSKLPPVELIDPLFSVVLECCSHFDSSVRRDAIITLKNISFEMPEYIKNTGHSLLQSFPKYSDPRTKQALLETLFSTIPEDVISLVHKEMSILRRRRNESPESHNYIKYILELIRKSPYDVYFIDSALSFCRRFLCATDEAVQLEATKTILSIASHRKEVLHIAIHSLFNLFQRADVFEIKQYALSLIKDCSLGFEDLEEFINDILVVALQGSGEIQELGFDLLLQSFSCSNSEIIVVSIAHTLEQHGICEMRKLLIKFLYSIIYDHPDSLERITDFVFEILLKFPEIVSDAMEILRSIIIVNPEKHQDIFPKVLDFISRSSLQNCFSAALFAISLIKEAPEVNTMLDVITHSNIRDSGYTECRKRADQILLISKLSEEVKTMDVTSSQKIEAISKIRTAFKTIQSDHIFGSDLLLERNILACEIMLDTPSTKWFKKVSSESDEQDPKLLEVITPALLLNSVCDIMHVSCEISRQNLFLRSRSSIKNQSNEKLYNVFLEFVPKNPGCGRYISKRISLNAFQSAVVSIEIPLLVTGKVSTIMAKLHYKTLSKDLNQVLPLMPIAIPLRHYLCGGNVSFDCYKQTWPHLEYEDKLKIRDILDPQQCIYDIQTQTGLKLVRPIQSISSRIHMHVCFFGKTIFGDRILLLLELENFSRSWSGKLTVRSESFPCNYVADEISEMCIYQKKDLVSFPESS